MTIGFIGGGNMATALISGLISSQKFKPAEITVYDIDAVKLKELSNKLGIVPSNSITELEERVDIIVLSVKPNIMPQILNNLNGYNEKIYISIAAGITLTPWQTVLAQIKRL